MRLLSILFAAGTLHASAVYNVVGIGGYGGRVSTAAAVNAVGQVIGNATTPNGTSVVFSSAAFTTPGAAPSALGTSARGEDINSAGTVVGTSYTNAGARAVTWKDGVASELLSVQSYGLGVNEAGDIVGARIQNGKLQAFINDQNGTVDLAAGSSWSAAYDINDKRQVAGTRQTASGAFRAFSWSALEGTTAIGTLGGSSSYGQALNNSGTIVGSAQTRAGYLHATLYDGTLRDLGTLGGTTSAAFDINDAGTVVGYSYDAVGRSRAFAWFGSMMLDLNTMIDSNLGWSLDTAYGINASGQIVGGGTYQGQAAAWLLDPVQLPQTNNDLTDTTLQIGNVPASVPEPGAMALMGTGLLLLCIGRRIRRQSKGDGGA
ncbi:MAG: PEP-CTERM sorting domain-containing protein [Bryobacteraceae bacterium]|nr:PEP-CTERM sorting domain-containing protein [Bryobacteraceae bacterium]